MSISSVVKRRREALKISQSDLAWLARVSRGTVGNIERGVVSAESRTLGDVLDALGLDVLSGFEGREVEKLPQHVARKIVHLLLEKRDGSDRLEASRLVARSQADEYLEFSEKFEDEDAPDRSEMMEQVSNVAEFVVPLLDLDSPRDKKVLDWFHDLGWSEDDYPDWEGLVADTTSFFVDDFEEGQLEGGEKEEEPVPSAVRSALDEEVRLKAAAFDKLPSEFRKALLSGSVAGHMTQAYKGGVGGAVFILPPADELDTQQVLLSMNRWWQANHWLQKVYFLLESKGAAVIDDPLAVFDAIEALMIAQAKNPDTLNYIREKYPNRIEELSSRYPDLATMIHGGDEDGSTE